MLELLNLENIVSIGTAVVTIASSITALTNTPKDDGVVKKLYKIIEVLAIVNNKVKQK
jgi:hypothetical protein